MRKYRAERRKHAEALTLMATGYTVQPISKLPFLNIITDVLLMQVPADDTEVLISIALIEMYDFCMCVEKSSIVINTLREDQDGLFGFVSNVIAEPETTKQNQNRFSVIISGV